MLHCIIILSNCFIFIILFRLLIDQDDPIERQLMVYVASINIVPQFLVPLFIQAVDEKYILHVFLAILIQYVVTYKFPQAICIIPHAIVSVAHQANC